MSRNNGTFIFGANLEPEVKAPLDARTLVDKYEDLVKDETWKNTTHGSAWTYVGMIVACADKPGQLFQLIDKDYTVEANWKTIGNQSLNTTTTTTVDGKEYLEVQDLEGVIANNFYIKNTDGSLTQIVVDEAITTAELDTLIAAAEKE